MSVVAFKYSRYKDYHLPVVPIHVKGGTHWHEVRVFVDSGATYSVFGYQEAERLEIDTHNSERTYVKVGDGSFISVYMVSLPIRVDEIVLEATIGFSKELGVGFNILGRKDVFERFTVCFNDREGVVKFITNDN